MQHKTPAMSVGKTSEFNRTAKVKRCHEYAPFVGKTKLHDQFAREKVVFNRMRVMHEEFARFECVPQAKPL